VSHTRKVPPLQPVASKCGELRDQLMSVMPAPRAPLSSIPTIGDKALWDFQMLTTPFLSPAMRSDELLCCMRSFSSLALSM